MRAICLAAFLMIGGCSGDFAKHLAVEVPAPAPVPHVRLIQIPATCQPRKIFVGRLTALGEVRIFSGIYAGGSVLLEVYASENGKTWSFLLTDTNGESCLVASGSGAFLGVKV